MSIKLKDARHELDVLEEFINNPELIMSDLSAYGVSDYDFLFRNITVNGKTFHAAMMEYLKQIEIFNNDDIFLAPYSDVDNVTVKISSFDEFHSQNIMCIDFINHTYKIIDDCIKYYNKIMNDEPEYEPYEIQGILKRYENYTLRKRLANAQHCLFNKDKTCSVRILDFFFSLFVSNKYLRKILDKEYKRVEKINKSLKKGYDEDVEKQKLYIQKAPEQIRKIEQKQKEIAKYLSKYGFKEKIEGDQL
jgi:hypothetical protein